jgi:acylphosphatase
MKMVRARVEVMGLVQGVFFRASTRDVAENLGLKGWVRNNPSGSVEAVFEGPEEKVKRAIEWCRTGPTSARVDNLDVSFDSYLNEFNGFTVLR